MGYSGVTMRKNRRDSDLAVSEFLCAGVVRRNCEKIPYSKELSNRRVAFALPLLTWVSSGMGVRRRISSQRFDDRSRL